MTEHTATAVRRRRLYQEVIDAIGELVRSGEIPVGGAFPSEKELSQRYDVSTAVVREAFRVMEHAGLVEGKQGGKRYLVSSAPSFGSLLTGFEKIVQQDLLEARRMVEIQSVGLAALRRQDDEVPRLRELVSQAVGAIEDNDAFRVHDMQVHLALARMTHNNVLIRLHEHINELRAARRPYTMSSADRLAMAKQHEAIVDAIAARDPDAAIKAFTTHLQVVQTTFEVSPEFKKQSS